MAISLPVEVSPSTVDSPRTSSWVVPPSDVGEGDGLGLDEGLELGLDDGDGDGEGVASWARVTLADKISKPDPAIKPAREVLLRKREVLLRKREVLLRKRKVLLRKRKVLLRKIAYLAPLLVFIFAVFSGLIIYRAAWFGIDKHFSLLAESFIKNDLFLNPNNLPDGDYADFNGKQYLFFGPMPSILLAPFVFVWGKNFPQITLSIASLVITYLAIYVLVRKLKFNKIDAFWLANFFVFGTVLYFVGLVNTSAYIVQAVGTTFVVLSILEYFTKRRWWLIGILIACAGATRITLFGIAAFFLLEIIRNFKKANLVRPVVLLMIPIILSLMMLGLYNLRKFGSIFDTGYTRNVSVLDKDYYNYKLGWFSPVHVSANLYSFLIMPPEPILKEGAEFSLKFPFLKANKFGMAIWFTSPLFIYLLFAKRESYTFSATVAIILIFIPSLLYWGIGAVQYGYRYSLDFLPLLFLILLSAFKKGLGGFAKLLIAFGVIFNCFFMSSLWNSYPLLSFFEYLD